MVIDPKNISVPQLQGYLQSAIAPRPIAFASTISADGEVNLSPFSFFNVFSANPPILIFSPARRGTNNTTKHTWENVLEVPEVVINIVNFALVEQASLTSTEYAKGVNEFEKAGLTAIPSELIRPPRVAESPVSMECTVEQTIPLGTEGGAGNLVLAQIRLIHIQDQYLDANGNLDTTRLDLVARMGGNWYTRASGDALFEIPKPLTTRGIGVDQLPEHARLSHVLTGNQLGRLGNQETLPTPEQVANARTQPAMELVMVEPDPEKRLVVLHHLVVHHLNKGNNHLALATLFT